MDRLGDTSAVVIPAGPLLLTRRGKTIMYTVGIVFEFYTVPLYKITVSESSAFIPPVSVARGAVIWRMDSY